MECFAKLLFWFNAFIIVWAMAGYPLSVILLGKIYPKRKMKKDYSHLPAVTVMVVAHNEEKVILDKLQNVLSLDYPKENIEFLVSSDNSTDRTNELVREFIGKHPEAKIRLYEVKERRGKTNAQNEAQKLVQTEFLVMTDANAMLEQNAVRELMASFTSGDIAYVCGKLSYTNPGASDSSHAENNYWEGELAIRETEGRIQTITAGNGALYACRTNDYHDFEPMKCHDSEMPLYYGLAGRRAVANHDAVAYEKAGEEIGDEFARKVRMNRNILKEILPDIRLLHVVRYRWFSYFYFGHRTCRYLLWLAHLAVLAANVFLFFESWFYAVLLAGQTLFYLLALVRIITGVKNRYLTMIYYYVMTVAAQWIAVYRQVTGKARPFWEKAQSTR
ncbi:MAG: glycosyltransferase family 2 protein [Lachnospiraceae bacterium]|nr:glycosyltransferase family 2 protein [Lachnospiraceae bacterium]